MLDTVVISGEDVCCSVVFGTLVEVCAVFCYCPLVARCLETIDVYIWRMFVIMSVVVIGWESVGMFVV